MTQTKRSCWFKGCIGCGSVVGIFILCAVLMSAMAWLNKPKPPEFSTIESGELLDPEGVLIGTAQSGGKKKTLRIHIKTSLTKLEIAPNDTPGKVDILGDYDKANFDLITKIEEKEDTIDYYIELKNKRSVFGAIFEDGNSDSDDAKNRLKLLLPKDQLLAIKADLRMGESRANLSGLAVESLDVEARMGKWTWETLEANQVEMKTLKINSKMGESEFSDLQNMRVRDLDIRSRMGQVQLNTSGSLSNDMEIRTNVSMGECRIYLPADAQVKSSVTVFMGESRTPKATEPHVGQAQVNIKGKVTMGSIFVRNDDYEPDFWSKYRKKFYANGVDATLAEITMDPELLESGFDESDLNRLGYEFLRQRNYLDAIKIFEANVKLFPEVPNCYDSLGEAYMLNGDKQKAIESYQKCLELDPEFESAREMLEKLQRNPN